MMGTLAFNMLTFDRHVGNFCKKASRKLNALVNYMDLTKRRILMNTFSNPNLNFALSFGYFLAVRQVIRLMNWMKDV